MSERCFDLGLVMAGAISAGAYTAGVMDFLIQALNEWETARGDGVPDHKVKIRVMAGASAGGMTSTITVAQMLDLANYEPVEDIPSAKNNRLYEAWVKRIDILKLLKSDDLPDKDTEIMSLFDSTIIAEIAKDALTFPNPGKLPDFFDSNLQIYLTTSNLRGVPYMLRLQGEEGETPFRMSNHADFGHFYFGDKNTDLDDIGSVHVNFADQAAGEFLLHATMATGAFPIGLAPRPLDTFKARYDKRLWRTPFAQPVDGRCFDYRKIPPNWAPDSEDSYKYTAVDGGVFNNEPIEFARRVLTYGKPGVMKQDAKDADRAILMIDPFPSDPPEKYEAPKNLLGVATGLLSAMRKQGMFKPDELLQAQRSDTFDRFLIAPTRTNDQGKKAEFPLASGGFGAFAGFLQENFRVHDFVLGRRNCQRFLMKHLTLDAQNPLFEGWRGDQGLYEMHRVEKGGVDHLPIIPVVSDHLREPIEQGVWPKMNEVRAEVLRSAFRERAAVLGKQYLRQEIDNFFTRFIAQKAYGLVSNKLAKRIMKIIQKDLKKRDQLLYEYHE